MILSNRTHTGVWKHHVLTILIMYADAVLERLRPTFDPDVPIDIIDMFPNGPLWSSKFHELLKPRRHVLIEPNVRRKAQFDDLLSHPDSRYSYLRDDPTDNKTIIKVFEDRYLPEQKEDAKARPPHAPNPNLLVLMNLARVRLPPHLGSSLFAKIFQDFADGTSINRYGAVRIITIVHNDFAEIILPKVLANRKRIQGLSEGVARILSIVRNNSDVSKLHLKGMEIIKKSADRVAERSKEAGPTFPPGRDAEPVDLAPIPEYINDVKSTVEYCPRPKQSWHNEYSTYDAMFKAGKFDRLKNSSGKFVQGKDPRTYKRYVSLRRRLLYENRQAQIVDEAAEIQTQIDTIDEKLRKLKTEHESGNLDALKLTTTLKDLVASRRELTEKLEELTLTLSVQSRRWLETNVNEARYFAHNEDGKSEPLLEWDRRPYEPFRSLPGDFDAQNATCAILDIRPDPSAPIFQAQRKLREQGRHGDSEAITRIWFHFCRLLFSRGKEPFSNILKQLFPSIPIPDLVQSVRALQRIALVSVSIRENANGTPVPSLYYGDDCLDSVLYRTVSTATLWAIAEHWHAWPFKPVQAGELHKVLGGGSVGSNRFRDDDY